MSSTNWLNFIRYMHMLLVTLPLFLLLPGPLHAHRSLRQHPASPMASSLPSLPDLCPSVRMAVPIFLRVINPFFCHIQFLLTLASEFLIRYLFFISRMSTGFFCFQIFPETSPLHSCVELVPRTL